MQHILSDVCINTPVRMGGEYPLSESQREAVNHFHFLKDGDVLAVSGPPGTGKTTLLQSIVADMLVSHALVEDPPPVIVATSTNNSSSDECDRLFCKDSQYRTG